MAVSRIVAGWVGRHVLLVDDDERFNERLALALRDRRVVVSTASTAERAIAAADTVAFDGVVTDLKMPGGGGLEVVRALASGAPSGPRVVVLSGYGTIATAVEAMRLGAVGCLVKPAHADQILEALSGVHEASESALTERTPSLALLEREHIERVLLECQGNVSKASRVLGIHRRTLQYKLAKYSPDR